MLPLDAIKSIDEYLALSEKKPSLLMKTTAQALALHIACNVVLVAVCH